MMRISTDKKILDFLFSFTSSIPLAGIDGVRAPVFGPVQRSPSFSWGLDWWDDNPTSSISRIYQVFSLWEETRFALRCKTRSKFVFTKRHTKFLFPSGWTLWFVMLKPFQFYMFFPFNGNTIFSVFGLSRTRSSGHFPMERNCVELLHTSRQSREPTSVSSRHVPFGICSLAPIGFHDLPKHHQEALSNAFESDNSLHLLSSGSGDLILGVDLQSDEWFHDHLFVVYLFLRPSCLCRLWCLQTWRCSWASMEPRDRSWSSSFSPFSSWWFYPQVSSKELNWILIEPSSSLTSSWPFSSDLLVTDQLCVSCSAKSENTIKKETHK